MWIESVFCTTCEYFQITLKDATVMMTVGDDDSAVKDILPIVMRAYQSSSIAEESGFIVKVRISFL